MRYRFMICIVLISLLFSFNAFGQTIQLRDLLNVRATDSVYMKDLFVKQQFYLQKIATNGKVTDYVYVLDSANDVGLRVFHANDRSFILTMIDYNFTNEKVYNQISNALQKSKFVLEPPGTVIGYNHAKVVGYRLGKVSILLSKFDPTIVKGLYCFLLQRTDFKPNGERR